MKHHTAPCPECMHANGCKTSVCLHDPCRCRRVCKPCAESIRRAAARTLDWKLANAQAVQVEALP